MTRSGGSFRPLPGFRRGVLLLVLLAGFGANVPGLSAQSPDWSATLLSAPFPSPFISEWERNPQTLTLSLNYLGSDFQEVILEGDVRSESRGVLALGESPVLDLGPGPTTRVLNVNDIFDWQLRSSRDITRTIVRSGVIPEGEYEACVRVLTSARIEVAEACTFFTIAVPDAPELLFPADGDPVQTIQPTFQWTPVSLPPLLGVRYRIRMAERLPRQTPEVALEANVPQLEREVASPLLVYPLDALDLVAGREYVWQVEAVDGTGQSVLPGGLRSEIQIFRAEDVVVGFPGEEESFPEFVDLVPGLARLADLSAVDVDRTPFGTVLNGPAWLELAAPYQQRVRVQLMDLTLTTPGWIPVDGLVEADAAADFLQPASSSDPLVSRLSLGDLRFRAGEGLMASGSLEVGDGSTVRLDGEVQVTSAGLFGTLRSPGDVDVFTAGADPIRLTIRDVTVELPGGPSSMTAEVEAFGGAAICADATGRVSADGTWSTTLGCLPDASLPLAGAGGPLGLELSSLTGILGWNLDTGALTWDLDARARLLLMAGDPAGCRADLDLSLGSGSGLTLDGVEPRCGSGEGGMELDWLTLAASSLDVTAVGYLPGQGVELEASLDLVPSLPALPALSLPPLPGVELDATGLSLPAGVATFDRRIDLLGYGLQVEEVTSDPVRISWADWSAGSGGGLAFQIEAELLLTGLGTSAPSCFAGGSIALSVGVASDGTLRLPLDPGGSLGAGECVLEPAPGLEFEVDAPTGEVVVDLSPPATLTTALQLTGSLRLPDPFRCGDPAAELARLSGSIGLLPDGGLEGSVTGFETACAFPVAGVLLQPDAGSLEFLVDADGQQATLSAGGGIRFGADDEVTSGSGSLTLDLVEGRLESGSLTFTGPFEWALPAEEPLFIFSLDAATLDPGGLQVDGRHRLLLGTGEMGVTFDQVTVGLDEGAITAGRVLFDTDFALEAGIDEQGGLGWAAREAADSTGLVSAFRVVLPATTALDATGLSIQGSGGAALFWEGRTLTDLGATFTDGFLLGLSPVEVDAGRLELASQGAEIAYVDALGFHPNLGVLGALLPDRLPLPSEAVAFLELRDAQGTLRVQTQQTAEGLRIFTEPGQTIPMVLPGFRFNRGQDPQIDIAVDLTLATGGIGGVEVVAGSLDVTLAPADRDALGLDAGGIPLMPESLGWSDPGDGYRLSMEARPVLLGDTLGASSLVALEVTTGGRLSGDFTLPNADSWDLVTTPGRFSFQASNLRGTFDVGLLSGGGSWSLALDGGLGLDLSGAGSPLSVDATLEASPAGVAFSNLALGAPDDFHFFGAGPVELGIADLAVPQLDWDSTTGWDFELSFDLAFRLPQLGNLETPVVPDLILDRTGFTIPEIMLTSLPAAELAGTGFRVTPLALRLPSVRVDPFGAGIDLDWNFSFDLSVALGSGAPPAFSGLQLTVLDASLSDGIFAGQIEPRVFQNPLSVSFGGDGMAFEIDSLGGNLFDDTGVQGASVQAAGNWRYPDFMRCPGDPDGIADLGATVLSVGSDGSITGSVQGLAPSCPLALGPLSLQVNTADLLLAAGPDGQEVSLDLDGAARLPGVTAGDTVTASGGLVVDLLIPEIESGSITVSQPFRWDLPADDPFLSFTVNQAVLDTRGLVLGGTGDLLLDGTGPGVGVTFADLTLGFPDFGVSGGSASFATGFALDATLDGSAVSWTARAPSSARPAVDAGFRMSLPASVSIDTDGLQIGGTGSASLTYADSTFATLDLDFSGGFGLGWDPAEVVAGRADFRLGQTDVAYLTRDGFFPGDIFGVLPVPARLPLPSEDIAYLQLRDPATDQVLVQSQSTAAGLRIFTGQGETVSLVVPGLAGTGTAPSVDVSFDVEVDGHSFAFLSGAVAVEAGAQDPSLLDLAGVDLPLDVRRLAYESGTGGYGFTLDARVDLPASMDPLDLELEGLEVTASGLTGTASLGSLSQGWQGGALATADLGAVSVRVDGARATFGQAPEIELVGGVDAAFFSDDAGSRSGLDLSGTVTSAGATFDVDLSTVPAEGLPIGLARFAPASVGSASPLSITATDSEFALRFAGVLSVPSLAPSFAVSLSGVSLGTGGVDLPTLSLTTQADYQLFDLFGASFTLMDTQAGPGIGLGWDGSVLTLTMNGDLDFLDQITRFQGLQVSTDGSLGMTGASLVDGPVTLVPGVLDVTALGIVQDRLDTELGVTLPAPFDGNGTQTVGFSLGPDGSVAGSGEIVLLDETTGLGGDRTQFGGSLATAHLKYLGLSIDPAQGSPGSLQMVGDIYLADDRDNRIALGEKVNNAVTPGLEIGLDGQVQWGNFSLPTFFSFDFEVLRLDLDNVSGGGTAADFDLSFGGQLAVNLPVVSGGLGFSGLRVGTALGLDASQASVTSGNIMIAEVLGVSLNGFGFSGTPTTLDDIQTGLIPTSPDSPSASASSTSLSVESYVRFGGSLSLGPSCGGEASNCLFSGGVQEFLFYRESSGGTSLVIRQASLSVPSFSFDADFLYSQNGSDGSFEVILGGSGSFSGTDVSLVGALERGSSASDIRAGLFLIASQEIQIVPAVLVLSEIGGGFFYRPKTEYCELVRQVSGVPDLSSSGSSCENVGKFTGFLYAGARVVTESLGKAQILLTASETGIQLDGVMALLSPTLSADDLTSAAISGTLNLTVGFQEQYAEGNFTMTADYRPLVYSYSQFGFYVYGSDAWGIYGSAEVNYLSLIRGDADFFVGADGFFVQGTIHAGFDFWIVAVSADATVAAWYLRAEAAGGEAAWGAYIDVEVKAEILGGAVSAKAGLLGALAGTGGDFLVYAEARAEGCVIGLCKTVWVHAKFRGGTPSGGFSRDPDMQGVLDDAQRTRNTLIAARDRVQQRVAAARPGVADLVLSEEELAQTYAAMTEWNLGTVTGRLGNAILAERQYRNYYNEAPQDSTYLFWYREKLARIGFPTISGTRGLRTLRDTVNDRLQEINGLQSAVDQRLAGIQLNIGQLQDIPDASWPEPPLRSTSVQAPQAQPQGDGTMLVQSQPGVDFSRQRAEESSQVAADRNALSNQARQEVIDRIQALESGLAQTRSALSASGDSSVMAFARLHGDAIQAAEEMYTRQGDLILRQQDWYWAQIDTLEDRESEVRQLLIDKHQALRTQQSEIQEPVANLAGQRAYHLAELSGNPQIFQAWQNVRPSLSQAQVDSAALNLGMQLWSELGVVGMQGVAQAGTSEFTQLRTTMTQRLNNLWSQHYDLTQDVDDLYGRQAELTGALYDMYDRFYYWVGGDDALLAGSTAVQATTGPDFSPAGIRARMQALEQELEVPTVDRVDVVSVNDGYMAREVFLWNGSHPAGTYEFLYNSVEGGGANFFFSTLGMQSNGGSTGRVSYALTPGRGTTSQDRTLRVGVRGGAGYLGFGRSSYETRFESGAGGQGVGDPAIWNRTADTSPPSTPQVRIANVTSDRGPYWTPSTTVLDSIFLRASDYDSGIQEYEYALGWQSDTTALVDWTSAGGRTEVVLRNLTMQEGGPEDTSVQSLSLTSTGGGTLTFDPGAVEQALTGEIVPPGYRVYARATNGEGLVSSVGRSAAIRIDRDPPTWSDGARLIPPIDASMFTTFSSFSLVGDGGFTFPDQTTNEFDDLNADAYATCGSFFILSPISPASRVPPSITLEVPTATDTRSGVDRYEYRVSQDSTENWGSGVGWSSLPASATSLTVDGPPLDYTSRFWVHLVAVDRAGHATEPLVYGPFTPSDPTPPEAPVMCVTRGLNPTSLRFRIDMTGGDPEVGGTSWSYRVRTPGGTVVRDWPQQPDYTTLSRGEVKILSGLSLTPGQDYYLDLRIENARGETSTAASGPVRAVAPPSPPAIIDLQAYRGSNTILVLPEIVTPGPSDTYLTPPPATHHWRVVHPSDGVVAQGTFVGDVGTPFTGNFGIPLSQVTAGDEYVLLLSVETADGMRSAWASRTWIMP